MTHIVHLGIGNFHRAHQAWYTQRANTIDQTAWRITGVSLRSAAIHDALAAQGFNYTLVIRDATSAQYETVRVHDTILVGTRDRTEIIEKIADPATSNVTMTVSEKGYYLDPNTGKLDLKCPEIAGDLASDAPQTAIGVLAHALRLRAQTNGEPINVISCDNLPENGDKLRNAVHSFCEAANFEINDYLTHRTAFPNSMVDRIVPATTDALRNEVARQSGQADAHPIATEAFCEWYLEDKFVAPIPAWGKAGVQIVADVVPFELRKLRLLNGSHSLLAYAGLNAGHRYVHEAVADPAIREQVAKFMAEATETLPPDSRDTAADYCAALFVRFSNPNLHHELIQIAMDGSLKLPIRIQSVIDARRALGKDTPAAVAALTAWSIFAVGQLRKDIALSDPKQAVFASLAEQISDDGVLADALLTELVSSSGS